MDRATFSLRLGEALAAARRFGQEFVAEELPESVRCRVLLNQSNDQRLRPGEVTYPEEESPRELLDLEEALGLLWPSGSVPEWIDVAVAGVTAGFTIVELLVCGRFTSKEDLLYHREGGQPPFHVTSPALPPGHEEGERFSLSHVRSRRAPS
jgi:hypothetical protein